MGRCSKEGVVRSCCGKEEAKELSVGLDRSVRSCRGKGEVENRRIGALKKVSCRGKEDDRCSEEGVVGSCRGKEKAEDW